MFLRSFSHLILMTLSTAGADGPVHPIRPDQVAGTAAAVVVDGAADLFHTRQIMPVDALGKVIAPDRADLQSEIVLEKLESVLKEARSGLDRLVKVDIYVGRVDAVLAFQKALARKMTGKSYPAISFVVGSLAPVRGDGTALDAIAVIRSDGANSPPRTGVLPAGPKIYISGQAEPEPDLAIATRKVLKSLGSSLHFLGLDTSRVVRLKAFMQPMTTESRAAVEREVSDFFRGKDVPPLSLVEWRLVPRCRSKSRRSPRVGSRRAYRSNIFRPLD